MIAFASANAAFIVLIAALNDLWTPRPTTRIPELWPVAVGAVALGAALVARALEGRARSRFLLRHLALLLVPLVGSATSPAGAAQAAWLAYAYVIFVFACAINGIFTLGSVAPRLRDGRIALLLAGVLLAGKLALLPYTTLAIMPEADEPHYLVLAQSIAFDRDLDLTNNYRVSEYGAFYPGRLTDVHAIQAGPRLLPIRDIGLPVIAALPFALAGRPGVLILIAVIAAFVVAQMYLLLRDLRIGPRAAIAGTAAVALTHPFHTYSAQIYPEMAIALCGIVAVRAMRRGGAMTIRDVAIAATAVALLPWFTTRAWFFAGGLGLALAVFVVASIVRQPERRGAAVRRLLALAGPGAALLGCLLLYNWLLFGLAMPGAGFYLVSDQQTVLSGHPLLGAGGLLFGRVFGLIGRAPLYLIAFVGIAALAVRRRDGGPLLAALALGWATHFLFIASLEHWHSDWAPPSRNLIATIPFLTAGVAAGLETLWTARHRLLGAAMIAAAAASLFVSVLFGAQPELRYELPARLRETGAPAKMWVLVRDLLGGIDVSQVLPRTTDPTDTTVPKLLAWTAIVLALAAWGWRATARHEASSPSSTA